MSAFPAKAHMCGALADFASGQKRANKERPGPTTEVLTVRAASPPRCQLLAARISLVVGGQKVGPGCHMTLWQNRAATQDTKGFASSGAGVARDHSIHLAGDTAD